jgi:hypothetical protein
MNFYAPTLQIQDTWSGLEDNLATCDFCTMRWNVAKHLNREDYTSVLFEKVDSTLRMNDSNAPALSICRSQGKS